MVDIGSKIRVLRLERGLSQRQLAGKEMSRGFISMLECGRTLPSERTLRILAQRLGKPVGFFRRRAPEDGTGVVQTLIEDASRKAESGHIDEAIAALEQVVEMCRGAYLLAEARFLLATLRAKGAPAQVPATDRHSTRYRFRRRAKHAG